jgi:L-fuculose-phosphate aldolase
VTGLLHEAEREQVVQACRLLRRERLVVGTAGNVSVRVRDHVVISPSGVDYERMTAADVGVHDLAGGVVQAELAPSSELPLHLASYAAYDHRAVVHTHSVASTAWSALADTVPASHYYTALFGGEVRVAPYATFGSAELAHNVTTALRDRTAALMGNHGAILVGSDLTKVLAQVEYLEYLCEVQLRVTSSGLPPRLLDPEEIERVRIALSGYGQEPTAR